MKGRNGFWSVLAVWLLFTATGMTQNTATILGTVKDQSAAVLPGAQITVTNVDTGIVRTAVAGPRGGYRLSALPVGTYDISATMTGFQSGVRSGITLTIGREAVVDFTLQVGNVAEQVTVTGEAPLIETTSATVSGLVDPKQIRDIPLNARSFIELVPLQAGAVFADSGETSATKGFGRKLAISGTRYNANSFLLDGADMNDAAGSAGSAAETMAGVETVREFKVITNAYDAEYGRHTGGVVSAVTKSGTNEIHGSLFEFLRNDNLDAYRWEDKAFAPAGEEPIKPEFRRNQFGGSLGGPVMENKLFFFGSYEGLREAVGGTDDYDVPGPEIRAGNFIETKTVGGVVVRDKTTFLGIDPAVAPFLAAYPEANTPCRTNCWSENPFWAADGTGLFVKQNNRTTDQNFYTGRLDYQMGDSDSVFGRLTTDRAKRVDPGFDTGEISKTTNYYATIEETHLFSPTFLAKTHFSFVRTNLQLFDQRLDELGLADYGLPVFDFVGSDVPGQLSIGGLQGWGGGDTNPKSHIQNTFQFKEDMYWSAGQHAFKMGGHFERFQFNQRSDFYAPGNYDFAGIDFFLENEVDAARFIRPGSDNLRGWRQNVIGFYLQDDINVRPGLSLNLGLRYEAISTPKEVNGKVATIRDMRPHHFYSVLPSETDIGDPYFVNPSLLNFAPRVGFAYTPFASGKLSLRGGIGIFHDQLLPNYYITSGVRMEPFYAVAELFQRDFTEAGIEIRFPDAYTEQRELLTSGVGKPQADGFEWKVSQPSVIKGSFTVQQQVASDTTLEVGYATTRGLHLVRGAILLNTTPVPFIGSQQYIAPDQPLPNSTFNRMRWRITDGISWYHAMLLTLNKRFSRGFQFQTSYTWSKSLDDSSTWTGSTDFGGGDRRGVRNAKWYGQSSFDVRHSFNANFVYELPGRNLMGATGKILGGWSLSGLVRMNSGFPNTPNATRPRSGSNSVTYVDGATLDLVPGGTISTDPQNPDSYFDVSQFAWPAQGARPTSRSYDSSLRNVPGMGVDGKAGNLIAVGNLGRNVLNVPGVFTFDTTLMKETAIAALGEAGMLQFRLELFNMLNRPNFGSPSTNLFSNTGNPSTSAGTISSTRFSPRQIQFALRLVF
jgi:hypothetical protein